MSQESEDYADGSGSDFDFSEDEEDGVGLYDGDGTGDAMDDEADNGGAARSLTPADLVGVQTEAIQEVNDVFQIPPQTARILLQHFKWDKDRLLERYFGGDREALFAEAHCIDPTIKSAPELGSLAEAAEEVVSCEVCMCDLARSNLTGASCGHEFCLECWTGYLSEQIEGQGKASIRCPGYGCDIMVDELTATRILAKSDKILQRYHYLSSKLFVAEHRQIQWCPAADCDMAVRVSSTGQSGFCRPVNCSGCKSEFCFNCQSKVHMPITCQMLRVWRKKCEDDSETANWINSNTKECPKCQCIIEKNGGCNHMTCWNTACKHDFCWVCLGPWEPHGSSWYNCSRFDESDSKSAQDAASLSRASLERYLFYFNRYANHENSIRLEGKLQTMIESKMQEIQMSASMSWIEVQFLKKAAETLKACRTVLMNTYVFAFYLAKNNEAEIFESNQKDLEMSVEKLSGFLEGQASKQEHAELKRQVQDKAQYCEQRCRVLLDHTNEGRDEDAWLYRNDTVAGNGKGKGGGATRPTH